MVSHSVEVFLIQAKLLTELIRHVPPRSLTEVYYFMLFLISF